MGSSTVIPPLPDGFQLDNTSSSTLPPLPDGFQVQDNNQGTSKVSSNGLIDLRQNGQGLDKSVEELTNLAGQGLLKTATGQGFQDRAIKSQTPDIPVNKEAPFDRNVIDASNPIKRATQIGAAAYSGTMGSMADMVTSPLGLLEPAAQGLKGVAPAIKASSEASYVKALGPTTKGERVLADKVAPSIVDSKPFVWTRGGLQRAAERNESRAAQALDEAYQNLPQDSKVQIKPIIDKINEHQNTLEVNGVVPEANQAHFDALDKMKADLLNVTHNQDVSPDIMREYRQVLDGAISDSKKGFAMTGQGKPQLLAQRALANGIRGQLATQYPDIAKINAQYSLWRNMTDLLDTTVPKTKSPLSTLHAYGAEAIGAANPHIGVFVNLQKLLGDNVAWNTFSGSMKSRLADLISKGSLKQADSMITSALNGEKIPTVIPRSSTPSRAIDFTNPEANKVTPRVIPKKKAK